METWNFEEWEQEIIENFGGIGSTDNIDLNSLAYEWCRDWCELLNQFVGSKSTLFASVKLGKLDLHPSWKLDLDLQSKIQILVILKDSLGKERLPFIMGIEYKRDSQDNLILHTTNTLSYQVKSQGLSDPYEWDDSHLDDQSFLQKEKLMAKLNHEIVSYCSWLD